MLNPCQAYGTTEKVIKVIEVGGGLMKSRISIVLAIVVAFVVGMSMTLYAQTQVTTLFKVEVPFEFRVGNAHLAAGRYIVFHVGSQWILFQSSDGKATAMAPVMVSSAPAGQSASKLVFNKYGDLYFLSQVWTEEDQQTHKCYQSRSEQILLASQRRSGTATVVAKR
jgi:hypothetical protein